MRSRRYNTIPTKVKIGVMTGGVKEDKAQLELNLGDLIRGMNYQEVDGTFHGYMSMKGYEVYDGTALASSIPAPILEDKGNDRYTTFLLDASESPTIEDLSREQSSITTFAIESTNRDVYNSYYNYVWKIGEGTTLDANTYLDPDTLLEPDSLLRSLHKDFSNEEFCIETLCKLDQESVSDVYYFYETENDISFFLDKVTGKINLTIGSTYAIEFDTTIQYGVYKNIALRRIGDNIYLSVNGVEDSSYLTLSAGYNIPYTDTYFDINFTGWLENYRISQGTYRRPYNSSGVVELFSIPYNHYSYIYSTYLDTNRESRRTEITKVGDSDGVGGTIAVYNNPTLNTIVAARNKESSGGMWIATGTGWQELIPEGFTIPVDNSYSFCTGRFDLFTGHQRESIIFVASELTHPFYITTSDNKLNPIIHSGLTTSPHPTSVIEFKNRLWFGFPDGRLVFSNVGDPLDFDPTTFSGEIYLEDKILNLQVSTGNSLIVFCENSIQVIKALSTSDTASQTVVDYLFSNVTLASDLTNYKNTACRLLDDVLYIDKRGLTSLSATDTYGDFSTKSYSNNVKNTLSSNFSRIVGAYTNKEYNQYRVFFNNGLGIIFTFDVKSIANSMARVVKGATFFRYLTDITCCSEEVFGDSNGYVYKIDSGTSYNGEEIVTSLGTSFYNYQSPSIIKHFKQLTIEGSIPYDISFDIKCNFDYRNINYIQSTDTENMNISGGIGGYYDSGIYDSIRYGESENQLSTFYINSYGTNMSVYIESSNKYTNPHIFSSIVVQYSWNGRKI